ncbi:MAG: DNA-directed RNA polymerase subunit L [Nanoarchaeota archaeon]|nr:DNA-directed RNA polymerase subunit L [Nanoarchaeota archaeon]
MELNILEEKKDALVFELKGATHTVANLLNKELWQNKHIKTAGYTVRHPLTSIPEFHIETDGEEPRKVVSSACQSVKKDLEKFATDIKKEVK